MRSRRNFTGRNSQGRMFRLPANQEISVISQQFGHVGRGRSEKSNMHFRMPSLRVLCPLHFVSVINKRTQHESDVAPDYFFFRNAELVSRVFEDSRQITGMNTRNILE